MNTPLKSENSNERHVPWYREPWGWFVFGPLFFIVFACAIIVSIAFIYSDDHVKDKYIKTGKFYEKDFTLESAASDLGIRAELEFRDSVKEIRLFLVADDKNLFDEIDVELVVLHPFKQKLDNQYSMLRLRRGEYVAKYDETFKHRRYLHLIGKRVADEKPVWKISGEIDFQQGDQVQLN